MRPPWDHSLAATPADPHGWGATSRRLAGLSDGPDSVEQGWPGAPAPSRRSGPEAVPWMLASERDENGKMALRPADVTVGVDEHVGARGQHPYFQRWRDVSPLDVSG
jgi:hypothetical protein